MTTRRRILRLAGGIAALGIFWPKPRTTVFSDAPVGIYLYRGWVLTATDLAAIRRE